MAAAAPSNFEQPASFAFDAEAEAELAMLIARYPAGKQASVVIPGLYVVQHQMKRQTDSAWVPVKGMDALAERLGMAPIRVYEVATFYYMFNMAPIGKYHLQVCTTTPNAPRRCWLLCAGARSRRRVRRSDGRIPRPMAARKPCCSRRRLERCCKIKTVFSPTSTAFTTRS